MCVCVVISLRGLVTRTLEREEEHSILRFCIANDPFTRVHVMMPALYTYDARTPFNHICSRERAPSCSIYEAFHVNSPSVAQNSAVFG